MSDLLLLSGGLDSSALAAWRRPDVTLFVDYGQVPAPGELRAAEQVAHALGLPFEAVDVRCPEIGSGLMSGGQTTEEIAAAEEWWPFRNQLLVTVAAAWGVTRGISSVLVGAVKSDGERHADGTVQFFHLLDQLVQQQEGGLRVEVPAIHLSSAELVIESGVPDSVLGWTFSCHRAAIACGLCPGCLKHERALAELGWLE